MSTEHGAFAGLELEEKVNLISTPEWMSLASPHLFEAILSGLPHRYVLVQETETSPEYATAIGAHCPPRFSVGAVQALRDPRYAAPEQLHVIGVSNDILNVPGNWLMAHQYIYLVHGNTDEFGWQYRTQYPPAPPGPQEEPWSGVFFEGSHVRRRIWMTTLVPRESLHRTKSLLHENLVIDKESVRLRGVLHRMITTNTSVEANASAHWEEKHVMLHLDRLELYTAGVKQATIPLKECEVKILHPSQANGRENAFSIRNSDGSVSVVLTTETAQLRADWVLAIQYQLAMLYGDLNFNPMIVAPPTGEYPDNRVMMTSELQILSRDGVSWLSRMFELRQRELLYYEDDMLRGRLFMENAAIERSSPEDGNVFSIRSASGITFNLCASDTSWKQQWTSGLQKQVDVIETHKRIHKLSPLVEQVDMMSPVETISSMYSKDWVAPPVEGMTEEYLDNLLNAPYRNPPGVYEFSDELEIDLDPAKQKPEENIPEEQTDSFVHSVLRMSDYARSRSEVKLLNQNRCLLNPRFVLTALKGMTHRFVLVLESEYHSTNATQKIISFAPARFTVGGQRASRDPRIEPLSSLIAISQSNPEVQFPSGWFMLHPYVYMVANNTDDNGWQYRSTWSGDTGTGNLAASDEQWVDTYEAGRSLVRRRLWMTTVVKRSDMARCKQILHDVLQEDCEEAIYADHVRVWMNNSWVAAKLYLYHNRLVVTPVQGEPMVTVSLINAEQRFAKSLMEKHDATHVFILRQRLSADEVSRGVTRQDDEEFVCDALSDAACQRWMRAILYQIAMSRPLLSYEPFIFGPPTGNISSARTILCGQLKVASLPVTDSNSVTDGSTLTWQSVILQLTEVALLMFVGTELIGRLPLVEATVVSAKEVKGDPTLWRKGAESGVVQLSEDYFLVETAGGRSRTIIAEDRKEVDNVSLWVSLLRHQIDFLADLKSRGELNAPRIPSASAISRFRDLDWVAVDGEYLEEEYFLMNLHEQAKKQAADEFLRVPTAKSGSSTTSSRVSSTTGSVSADTTRATSLSSSTSVSGTSNPTSNGQIAAIASLRASSSVGSTDGSTDVSRSSTISSSTKRVSTLKNLAAYTAKTNATTTAAAAGVSATVTLKTNPSDIARLEAERRAKVVAEATSRQETANRLRAEAEAARLRAEAEVRASAEEARLRRQAESESRLQQAAELARQRDLQSASEMAKLQAAREAARETAEREAKGRAAARESRLAAEKAEEEKRAIALADARARSGEGLRQKLATTVPVTKEVTRTVINNVTTNRTESEVHTSMEHPTAENPTVHHTVLENNVQRNIVHDGATPLVSQRVSQQMHVSAGSSVDGSVNTTGSIDLQVAKDSLTHVPVATVRPVSTNSTITRTLRPVTAIANSEDSSSSVAQIIRSTNLRSVPQATVTSASPLVTRDSSDDLQSVSATSSIAPADVYSYREGMEDARREAADRKNMALHGLPPPLPVVPSNPDLRPVSPTSRTKALPSTPTIPEVELRHVTPPQTVTPVVSRSLFPSVEEPSIVSVGEKIRALNQRSLSKSSSFFHKNAAAPEATNNSNASASKYGGK